MSSALRTLSDHTAVKKSAVFITKIRQKTVDWIVLLVERVHFFDFVVIQQQRPCMVAFGRSASRR